MGPHHGRLLCRPRLGSGRNHELSRDLPVTAELRQALGAWEEEYDTQSLDNPPSWNVVDFSRMGRELAREVKRQLPDWTVIYFDQEAIANRSDDALRESFEYEIKL